MEKTQTKILTSFPILMPKIKNIVVIGGAGFIGSHIVDKLVSQGHNVLVLDNFSSGSLKNINKKAEWLEFDIRSSPESLAQILKNAWIDEVYHLAAEPYIPECYERPKEFFEVNAVGTMNVLLACKMAGVKRVLYWSSSEVYGTQEGLISEQTPTNPQSTYAVSKLAADRLCFTLYKEQKIPVIILRQFNSYGERETHEYVIPEIISQLAKSNTVRLGNIKAKRDFIYVGDAAEIAVELMEKGKAGEVYNLGSGSCYSIEEIAYKIGEIMGKEIKIEIDKKKLRPFDVEKLQADNSKIYKVVSKKPTTSFEEGLKKTIDWFYENGQKWGFE